MVDTFDIGDYSISLMDNGDYWLEHVSGEGMQVNKEMFDQLIAQFYADNF